MITKIAAAVSDWLVAQGAVTDKDKSLFAYAVYSFLFGMTPIVIVVVLGLIFDMLAEGLLLITPFMLLRKFSGGYHLKSPLVCVITSTTLLTLSLLSVRFVVAGEAVTILSSLVLLATVTLFLLSPIDSEARRLSTKEVKTFKVIARAIAVLFLVIYVLLIRFNHVDSAAPIGVGMIIPAILQLPCVIQRMIAKYRANNQSRFGE